jgi:hypothetical protein
MRAGRKADRVATVPRRFACAFAVLLALAPHPALAEDAGEDAPQWGVAPFVPPPEGDAGKADGARRPTPGPAVRERNTGRRSRAGSTASGLLIVAVIVFAMGRYVIKKFRR